MRTLPPTSPRRAALAAVLLTLSCGGDSPSGPSGGDNSPDPNAVAQVVVSPSSGTVNVGATLQFSAVATNSAGGAVATTVTWSSAAPAVATVSASGLVTGVAPGSAALTASAGGRSATATVTVVDPTPPAAPSDLAAEAVSHVEVDLTWTDNAGNETGFVIERELAASSSGFAQVGTVGADVASFQDSGLTPATAYRYRVRATNANGDSDHAGPAEATTHDVLAIVTSALDDGTVNQAYTETLSATGGSGTYQWSLEAGALPTGLTLSGEGVVSGTPTAPDSVEVTLAVASGGQSAEGTFTLVVRDQILAPEVETTELPAGAVGVAYSQVLEASRGDGTYTWTLTGGSLPAGLTLAADGTVSGTPTAAGSGNFSVQVQSAGMSGTGSVSITINAALAVTTDSLPSGRVGSAYTASFSASGGDGTYTWEAVSGVPAGLALATTGTLSGTPTTPGSSTVSVKVTSGDGQTRTASLPLAILDTLRVTTATLADGQVGQSYTATLTAAGGSGTNSWSVTAGALPAGLTLAASTGVISGTPTASDTAAFTVQVASSDGQLATAALQIRVVAGPVTITTTSLPGGVVGSAYSATLAATGGDGVSFAWSVATGSLPTGLSLNGATGAITGTPSAVETANFTVQATSGGQSDTQALSIAVASASVPGYQIELVYLTDLSATHQTAFENAKARWESIITEDVQDRPALPACNDFHPATPGPVDDLVIFVTVDAIDGVGGTVGQAGPCYIRSSQDLAITGAMTFDEADLNDLGDLLESVILHEMGHVLGIGTVWESAGLLSGQCTVDPFFTGAGARAAFNSVGGVAYVGGGKVPVENTGTEGDGSNCGHWRESVFDKELMTPILTQGAQNPLSTVTVQSLADLGYTVTNAGADAYALPAPGPAGADVREGAGTGLRLGEVLQAPRFRVMPDGRVEVVPPVQSPPGR